MKMKKDARDYLLPSPKKLTKLEEEFHMEFGTKILLEEGTEPEDYDAALNLKNWILEKCHLDLAIDRKNGLRKGDIVLRRSKDVAHKEGYTLAIQKDYVAVTASTGAGLLYGVQTLKQMIAMGGVSLPGVIIEDAPSIENRGFIQDATRCRVRKLSSYKKLADLCSYLKYNQLQLNIEHSFLFEGYSEVCRDDTPLTAEDILELDQYCAKLHIELVPSMSTFGHFYKVLRTRSFRDLGELPEDADRRFSFDERMLHHTLNVADDRAEAFVTGLLDEFLPLFRSNHVNICADETFDLGKGASKELAEKVGVNQMYVDFVNKIVAHCKAKGKEPMFWGDIITGCPEFGKQLPKDIICLNWGYCDNESEDNTRKLAEIPMRQYLCPGVHGWRHVLSHIEMAYANISLMCGYALKYQAEGVLNTDWGDYGHLQDPMFAIPGMVYAANFAWSGEGDEAELNRRISYLLFGDGEEELLTHVRALGMLEQISWEAFVQVKETCEREADVEKQKEFFTKIKWGNPTENHQKMETELNAVRALWADLNETGKDYASRILLFTRGQQLIDRVMYAMSAYLADEKAAALSKEERFGLATELENWMADYKKIWRKDSRESELYRNADVFYWYADFLRSKENVN